MKLTFKLSIVTVFVCLLFVCGSILNEIPLVKKESMLRTINVSSLDTLSYSERAEEELEKFEEFDIYQDENDENVLIFTGIRMFDAENFSDVDFVNNIDKDEKVAVNYNLECNKKTTELNAQITYGQKDCVLGSENLHIKKIEYDEINEISLLYFEDGTVMSSNEMFDVEANDHCSVLILPAIASIVEVVTFVVVLVCIAIVIYYVVKWLFSWCSKFKIKYRYEERTIPKITTYTAPAITINGVRFESKALTETDILALPRTNSQGNSVYYLAFAAGIPLNGNYSDSLIKSDGLYICEKQLSYNEALLIMQNPTYTKIARDNGEFGYVASIYTYSETYMLNVMDISGYATDTPRNHPQTHNGGLWHYHPSDNYFVNVPYKGSGTKKYRPHAFFSDLDQSYWLQY